MTKSMTVRDQSNVYINENINGEKYEKFKSHPIKGRKEKIDLIRIFLD